MSVDVRADLASLTCTSARSTALCRGTASLTCTNGTRSARGTSCASSAGNSSIMTTRRGKSTLVRHVASAMDGVVAVPADPEGAWDALVRAAVDPPVSAEDYASVSASHYPRCDLLVLDLDQRGDTHPRHCEARLGTWDGGTSASRHRDDKVSV